MRKMASNQLTAGMLSSNFNEKLKRVYCQLSSFYFYQLSREYQHIGISFCLMFWLWQNFFMTLSSADLKWNELVSIINKLNKQRLSQEDIRNLANHHRCQLLNSNPIIVARHFQYRVEVFFKEIIIDDPLGKTKYYAIHVEFQVRGSPHVHCFLWVMNAPMLNSDNKEEYVAFVD